MNPRLLLRLGKLAGLGPVADRAGEQLERLGHYNAAHDYALQRDLGLRRIRFADGRSRWVAFDDRDRPVAAFPAFAAGDPDALRAALSDVRLDKVPRVEPKPPGLRRYRPGAEPPA